MTTGNINQVGLVGDFRITFAQLDPSALVSPKEYACLLGITINAFYKRNNLGEFPRPAMSRNRCVRWRAGDVREWLNGLNAVTKRPGPQRKADKQ
jgi:predicted DNA-binding transcriptional regulator AlpA